MRKLPFFCVLLVTASLVVAHPHFQKTTTATLPGDVKVTLSYYTVPVNMTHAETAAVGSFLTPGRPKLEIPSDLNAGSVTIPAGTYTVGAIKNSMDDWAMGLSPGELTMGASPNMSKVIKLDSQYIKSSEPGEHLWVDIGPGYGKFSGKAIVDMGFGPMILVGLISDAP